MTAERTSRHATARARSPGVGARSPRLGRALTLGVVLALSLPASLHCGPGLRAAVSLKVTRAEDTPRDAAVYIDEEFVGFLGVVAARGVRLPEGRHRITIEREGYFPWDAVVVSDRKPIQLEVRLVRIPD